MATILVLGAQQATALDLITDALLEIGVASVGESVPSEDANLGLSTLNSLLEAWSTQNLNVYASVDATYTLVPGQATYTVGLSGNFNGPRPLSVEDSAYVRYQGNDYPVDLIDNDRYNAIPVKSQSGILPDVVQFNPAYPLATFTFFPVPTQAITFTFTSNVLFTSTLTLATVLTLPPGYYRALRLNLALELAQRYGRQLGAQTLKLAATSLGDLKRANKRTPISRCDETLLSRGSSYTAIIAGR